MNGVLHVTTKAINNAGSRILPMHPMGDAPVRNRPLARTQLHATYNHRNSEAPGQQCTTACEPPNTTSLLIGSLAFTVSYCNPSSTHLQGRRVHCAMKVSLSLTSLNGVTLKTVHAVHVGMCFRSQCLHTPPDGELTDQCG